MPHEALELLDVDYVALIGHSSGGVIAIELADRFPGLTRSRVNWNSGRRRPMFVSGYPSTCGGAIAGKSIRLPRRHRRLSGRPRCGGLES